MKNTLTYTEAAEILGVHRQSVANYVDRGLLVRSTTNRKAVTRESVENLMIRYRNFGRKSLNEVEMLKDQLGMPDHALKDTNEFNKYGGKERVAAPYALLEGRRRQLR